MPQLLITIIRNAVPCQDHTMKKLLLLYWEVLEKSDPSTGKLKPEMILAWFQYVLVASNSVLQQCSSSRLKPS